MKYNEKIYFTEDVVKEYARKRKNLKTEEVDDLLRCLIKYLKNDIKYDKEYAYEIPRIGMLYIPFETVEDGASAFSKTLNRFDKIMFEKMMDKSRNPLFLKPRFEGIDLEEL